MADAITEANAGQVRAAYVVEAANIPTTEGAQKLLHERGVIVVPDFVANGGTNGGAGGAIWLEADGLGGQERVEVFNNGRFTIFLHDPPGVSVGSIEGLGQVILGANRLTVGSNNLSTTFSGSIADGESDKADDLVKALLAGKFEGWNGTITFSRGEGPYWQQWSPPMLMVQYTRVEQPFTEVKIIAPAEFKTGEWVSQPK